MGPTEETKFNEHTENGDLKLRIRLWLPRLLPGHSPTPPLTFNTIPLQQQLQQSGIRNRNGGHDRSGAHVQPIYP